MPDEGKAVGTSEKNKLKGKIIVKIRKYIKIVLKITLIVIDAVVKSYYTVFVSRKEKWLAAE